jgi:hypothetical protein
MNGLFGIHITPPERAVVPPRYSVFSSTTTDLPSERISKAELIEPPPLPTTTKSNVSSKPAICISIPKSLSQESGRFF